MGKKGTRYTAEYKRRLLELYRSGRTVMQLSAEFGVYHTTIREWIQQADIDQGTVEGLTTDERAELVRLRRENAKLQEEREILKKFAAWSAQEANWNTKKRSDS